MREQREAMACKIRVRQKYEMAGGGRKKKAECFVEWKNLTHLNSLLQVWLASMGAGREGEKRYG